MVTTSNDPGASHPVNPPAAEPRSAGAVPFPKSTAADAALHGEGGAAQAPADSELLQRVVQGAHHTIDRLADQAAPHVQRLQEGVAHTAERLQQRAGLVCQSGDEWTQCLRSTVRDRPITSVLTALALGVVFARLTS